MTEEEKELKVNLEDIVILSESIGKLAQKVYASHVKIVNNKDSIKTPTKEQIEQIFDNYTGIGLDDCKTTIIKIIEEWEKIRR